MFNYFNEQIKEFFSLEIDLLVVCFPYAIFILSLNKAAYLQKSVAL